MNPKHYLFALCIVLFTSQSYAETPVYAALYTNAQSPNQKQLELGIKDAIKDGAAEYYGLSVDPDQPEDAALQLCLTMLQRKPNVLILPATPTDMTRCLERANALSIKIVSLDQQPGHAYSNNPAIDIALTVGFDDEAAGELSADYMVDVLGADRNGRVLLIEAPTKTISGDKRVSGFTNRLAKLAPQLQITSTASAANQSTSITDALTNYADIQGIFATSDDLALSAIEMLPPNNTIPVMSIDGSPEAVDAVREGKLAATFANLPYLIGKSAVAGASALLADKNSVKSVLIEPLPVTREILEAGNNPLLKYLQTEDVSKQ